MSSEGEEGKLPPVDHDPLNEGAVGKIVCLIEGSGSRLQGVLKKCTHFAFFFKFV